MMTLSLMLLMMMWMLLLLTLFSWCHFIDSMDFFFFFFSLFFLFSFFLSFLYVFLKRWPKFNQYQPTKIDPFTKTNNSNPSTFFVKTTSSTSRLPVNSTNELPVAVHLRLHLSNLCYSCSCYCCCNLQRFQKPNFYKKNTTNVLLLTHHWSNLSKKPNNRQQSPSYKMMLMATWFITLAIYFITDVRDIFLFF